MKPSFIRAAFAGMFLVLSTAQTKAALIAYEGFDYAGGVNFSATPSNGGTGWTGAWESTGLSGVSGLLTSGTGQSLAFAQAPPDGFYTDGSNHVWSDTNRGNDRTWSPAVDLATQTLYFTALIRVAAGADVVDMRATFWDGASATGNMRANIGISNGGLFVGAATDGYITSGDNYATGLVADQTTYLLAMKRTGSAISGSLITANGNLGTLQSEPTWQVTQTGASGVDLQSMRLILNGGDGGTIRVDELRIATDWSSAVSGLAIPEPSAALLGGLGLLALLRRRR